MTKKQFMILSWTWGFISSFIGFCISGVLLAIGRKPKKWGWSWYFEVGNSSSAFTCGPFFFAGSRVSDRTKNHEFGHGIQNTQLGPLMVLVTLMSVVRYWYRDFLHYVFKVKYSDMKPYDSAWWEGEATKLGTELIERLKEQ